jgi:predicted porin
MKKKLLAVAVGATLAASVGVTQATEVTVYGMAHVSVDYIDADRTPATDITNNLNVADNSSRFGVKAKEDLGGGWAGLAQFEIFVDNTEAAKDVNSNRDNFVGIEQKSIGKLLLGRRDSAVKDVGGIADLFYREQIGENRAIVNYAGMDSRNNESATYESAKFGPVTVKLQWVGNDSATNTNTGWNANVRGTFGPVTAGLAYYVAEATGENTDGYRLALAGNIGPVKLTGLYQAANFATNNSRAAYGVGAAWKFGNNTLKAQYYVADTADVGTDNGANMYAIGYDYGFSKTTVVYAVYGSTSNDANTTSFGIGGNGHGEAYTTDVAGGSVSAFSIGTRMSF